ncbi:MAG: histidinol-phosphate transaminase [Treponema sp.]|nr:histidinol-phosphate transaminase [Treponema sp.]MDY5122670.1 histidinol-phosphate transaminase [Treponema sp.]
MDYRTLLRESIKVLPESKRAARQPKSSNTTPDIYRLNYNESPYGPSPVALEALAEASKRPFVYPDWFSVDLKTNFAKLHGLPDMMYVCTATGSSSLINILGEIFLNTGDEVVLGDPSYEAFRDTCLVNGGVPVMVPLDSDMNYDLDAMLAAVTPKTKIMVICNPNNPTGTYIDSAKLEKFIKKVPEHVLVVIDEAYLEFVSKPGTYSMIKMIKEGYEKPLLILKTFSKAYGMAGLRIGVAAGNPDLISLLGKSGAAWNISALGQAMAAAALTDQEYIRKVASLNEIEREKVTAELKALGCTVYESQTNFILFKAPEVENTVIAEKLAEQKVLIGAPVGMNRVSLGTTEMNDKFLKVLKEIIA